MSLRAWNRLGSTSRSIPACSCLTTKRPRRARRPSQSTTRQACRRQCRKEDNARQAFRLRQTRQSRKTIRHGPPTQPLRRPCSHGYLHSQSWCSRSSPPSHFESGKESENSDFESEPLSGCRGQAGAGMHNPPTTLFVTQSAVSGKVARNEHRTFNHFLLI